MRERERERAAFGVALALILFAAAPSAWAQVGLQIGEQVTHAAESPHPYPAGSPPGTLVWQHEIEHPGAAGLWVHLDDLDLAPGDWLVVRNGDSSDSETFTGQGRLGLGTFWSDALAGDTLILELWSDGGSTAAGVTIDRYAWAYPVAVEGGATEGGLTPASVPDTSHASSPTGPRAFEGDPLRPDIPSPAAICGAVDLEDAACQAVAEPVVLDRARAVARIEIFLDGGGVTACTGWLASCDGHLVTNNHCIDSGTEAFEANYEFLADRPTCRSPIPLGCSFLEPPRGTIFTGASLLATNVNLDFSLLQVPGDPQLEFGWLELDPVPAAVGDRIYIPQHAAACSKQLGINDTERASGLCEVESLTETPCVGGATLEIGYTCDTRGGSSGSPVLRHDTHQVIGLHHCRGAALGCGDPNRAVPIQTIATVIGGLLGPTEMPDEVTGLMVTKDVDAADLLLAWSPTTGADSFRIYRGSLGTLPPGTYDHLADDTVPIGSCREAGLSRSLEGQAAYIDGSADHYYLVVGVAECGAEGPYGDATVNGTTNPPVPRPAGLASCP